MRKHILSDTLSLLLIYLVVILFFTIIDTTGSGFHLNDDKEVLVIHEDLQDESFLSIVEKYVLSDLSIRFRPLYFVHRVLKTQLFGLNFNLWSWYNVILFMITLTGYYLGMRQLKCTISESFLFLLLTFAGIQMTIWWQLGTNETLGMVMLSCSFFFMVRVRGNHSINTLLFSIFLILASWCKESFILIIPAFIVFKIWNDINMYGWNVNFAISKNKLLIFPIGVLIMNMVIIVTLVGTNEIGYAGIGDEGVTGMLKGVYYVLFDDLARYLLLLVGLFIIMYLEMKSIPSYMKFILSVALPIAFFLLVMVPNILLYAKSGIINRYLLPGLVGYSFLVVFIIRSTRNEKSWLYYLLMGIFYIVSINLSYQAYETGIVYGRQGYQNQQLFSTLYNNYKAGQSILYIGDPAKEYEWTHSVEIHLEANGIDRFFVLGTDKIFGTTNESKWDRSLRDRWYRSYTDRLMENMTGQPDFIIFLNSSFVEGFFLESELTPENYKNLIPGNTNYTLLAKN